MSIKTKFSPKCVVFSSLWLFFPCSSFLFGIVANTNNEYLEQLPETSYTGQGVSILFMSIPASKFQMGCSIGYGDEQPAHELNLNAFQISNAEITNEQYVAFLNSALASGEIIATNSSVIGATWPNSGKIYLDLLGSYNLNNKCQIIYDGVEFKVKEGWGKYPVVYVTWYGAYAFAAHYGFRLPTEAEWEYAARGDDLQEYGTDDGTIKNDNANYDWIPGYATPAGEYPANLFGLYDMTGNLWEWCNDWYESGYYKYSPQNNPTGPVSGSSRVLRGGSWNSRSDKCRAAFRYEQAPDIARSDIGFRVAR